MPRGSLTRRHALRLGAAAAALGALAPRPALALRRPAVFELALDAPGAGGWRTLPAVRAPRRFDLVGLRWARGAGVQAQVRARRAGGAWSRWTPLAAHPGHAPDGARAVAGTEPVWTGAADLVQFRLRGDVRGLRARFVRAQPRATLAGRAAARLRGRARTAQAGPPRIIPRAEWGGDSVPPRGTPSYGEVHMAFVHHTVTANDYGPEDSAAIVLGIARYHRDSNRWNDIGYNFVVDQYGQVFEARAGGVDKPVIGAQAQGYNSVSTGVACLGTWDAGPFPEAGVDAVGRLLGWKLALHAVPAQGDVTVTSAGGSSNRYAAGRSVTFARISGHRDGNNTACPGGVLYTQLEDIRRRAAAAGAAGVAGLSIRTAAARVRYPRPASASGTLRFADGAPAAGAAVVLEWSGSGVTWQKVGDATCGPDGTWSRRLGLPGSGFVRAVFAGDAAHPRMEAAPVLIQVLPLLTLKLGRRRLRTGGAVEMSGTMTPAVSRVQVIVERQAGSRWAVVQRKRINVRGNRYGTRIRLRRRALYRITVLADASARSARVRAT